MSDDFAVAPDSLAQRAHAAAGAASSLECLALPGPPAAGGSTDEIAAAIQLAATEIDQLAHGLTALAAAFVESAARYDATDDTVAGALLKWSAP